MPLDALLTQRYIPALSKLTYLPAITVLELIYSVQVLFDVKMISSDYQDEGY